MTLRHLIINSVTYTYSGSIEPVFSNLSAHFATGWTGVVGPNGSGKTTLLRIAAGELIPQHGTVSGGQDAVFCSQRTDTPSRALDAFLVDMDGDACTLRGQLGIEPDWAARWDTLSHGERKRAQIATALWRRPPILIADEPTNHIDGDTRELLMRALTAFAGVGIIVSHDRTMLDTLCCQCLFLDDPPLMRPGGYTSGMRDREHEQAAQIRDRHNARTAYRRLKREYNRRKQDASQADRKRSKRGLSRKDHDARAKKDLARVTGKDGAAGRRLSQLSGRLAHAHRKFSEATAHKTPALGIQLPGSRARRDMLFHLPEGSLPLGGGRELCYPVLAMLPGDRVGITGANGTGKSSLVDHIMKTLSIPDETVVYIPQEISAQDARKLMDEVRRLSSDTLGHIMELVSHLNSRPERLLQTDIPSPGETRKLLLALGMQRDPHLIIMDEPTNHLDLPSIECVEQALSQCSCGLLLVSHDRMFLEHTTEVEWHITTQGQKDSVLHVGDEMVGY